ncbi:uncharacterized protein LOC101449097 [Ceratitis capitata]|uniref:uncharacterized protein LOC101449097 n=1 Tax=Ceratitis capitata TaxID=7213 RepID=UPI0003297E03|nr:uncharacterized protein LOC101449097 [Ceratitis capitata]XP_020714954.1 uncharacterized protein LOC101449097 [Ceratitis capitata]
MPTTHHYCVSGVVALNKAIQFNTVIVEINSHVSLFRDMLIQIGQPKDCPELRENIRKLRRICVDTCKHMGQAIIPEVRSTMAEGLFVDNPHLVILFYLAQLFLRELVKCYRLTRVIPMDMSSYYETRAVSSNFGNLISQILLCKQITPDFKEEELCSVAKDSQEIATLITELQEYMPKHESLLERNSALEDKGWWNYKKRRNLINKHLNLLCCVSKPSYLRT